MPDIPSHEIRMLSPHITIEDIERFKEAFRKAQAQPYRLKVLPPPCSVHKIRDGYVPTYPEGTIARAFEDFRHAWRAVGVAVAELILSFFDKTVGGR